MLCKGRFVEPSILSVQSTNLSPFTQYIAHPRFLSNNQTMTYYSAILPFTFLIKSAKFPKNIGIDRNSDFLTALLARHHRCENEEELARDMKVIMRRDNLSHTQNPKRK